MSISYKTGFFYIVYLNIFHYDGLLVKNLNPLYYEMLTLASMSEFHHTHLCFLLIVLYFGSVLNCSVFLSVYTPLRPVIDLQPSAIVTVKIE